MLTEYDFYALKHLRAYICVQYIFVILRHDL